jgi:class 3 adenylate cyclase
LRGRRHGHCGLAAEPGPWEVRAIFRENDIDEAVLPSLTHENLKELGVASFGHRVKLLDAIAALRSGSSGKTPPVDGATPSDTPSPRPEDRAERRQVTVMFSDLVGSTALSARMDPEDLREVISAYQKCAASTVQRFGGFVAKYMGDGVLIYFGYPQAHEDDAERAVRAGLELVDVVGALKTHAPLQTRVGIATGLVVVGDLIGSGSAQEQAIVGETPNLAARLQGVAEPDTVVIAESTRIARLSRGGATGRRSRFERCARFWRSCRADVRPVPCRYYPSVLWQRGDSGHVCSGASFTCRREARLDLESGSNDPQRVRIGINWQSR